MARRSSMSRSLPGGRLRARSRAVSANAANRSWSDWVCFLRLRLAVIVLSQNPLDGRKLAPAGGRRRGRSFVPVGAAQTGSVQSFGRNRRFLHFSKLTVRDFAVRRTAAEQRRTPAAGRHGARAARSLRRLLFRRHKVLGGLLFAIVAKSLELRTQHRTFHHHAAHLALRIFKLIRDRSVLRPKDAACFDRALSAGKEDVVHGGRV